MANLTNIFTGMEKGPEVIEANFEALNVDSPVVSAWSTTGITYKNSFAAYTDATNTLHYRTIDSGGKRTIELAGWVKTPRLASNASSLAMCNIPMSLFKGYTGFVHQNERYTCFWGDQWQSIVLDPATGDLKISNMSSRGTTDHSVNASAIQINYSVDW